MMEISWNNKTIVLSSYDLESGFPCPVCGHPFVPNGTGPMSQDKLSSLLKGVPSELVVGGIPPRFHDAAYLLCPEGWKVIFRLGGKSYIANDKVSSDKGYFRLMMDMHKDARGLARLMLWVIAKRNYLAVKLRGKSSYRHKHG